MKYHMVNIYFDGEVDNQYVNVSQGDGDVVVWRNPHHFDFTVHFDDNPFTDGPDFIVPARSDMSSGTLKTAATPGRKYDYNITDAKMAMASDPGIVIKP